MWSKNFIYMLLNTIAPSKGERKEKIYVDPQSMKDLKFFRCFVCRNLVLQNLHISSQWHLLSCHSVLHRTLLQLLVLNWTRSTAKQPKRREFLMFDPSQGWPLVQKKQQLHQSEESQGVWWDTETSETGCWQGYGTRELVTHILHPFKLWFLFTLEKYAMQNF